MTKTRSFRLTGSNEIKLKEIKENLKLDNENMTLNKIIEEWHETIRWRPIINAFKDFLDRMETLDY